MMRGKGANICGAIGGRIAGPQIKAVCNRPSGHGGDHVDSGDYEVVARWLAAPEARTPETTAGTTEAQLLLAALNAHVARCEWCSRGDGGCEIGERIEDVMLRFDPKAYDSPAPVAAPAPEVRALVEEARRLLKGCKRCGALDCEENIAAALAAAENANTEREHDRRWNRHGKLIEKCKAGAVDWRAKYDALAAWRKP